MLIAQICEFGMLNTNRNHSITRASLKTFIKEWCFTKNQITNVEFSFCRKLDFYFVIFKVS